MTQSHYQHQHVQEQAAGSEVISDKKQATSRTGDKKKLGRNDPCWCGAKKSDGAPIKYKHCHYPN